MFIKTKLTRKVTVNFQQDIVCVTNFQYLKKFIFPLG